MKRYETPVAELVMIVASDVIATSSPVELPEVPLV